MESSLKNDLIIIFDVRLPMRLGNLANHITEKRVVSRNATR